MIEGGGSGGVRETPSRILREVMERCGASLPDEEREEYEDRMGAACVIMAVRAYGAATSAASLSIALAEPEEWHQFPDSEAQEVTHD